MIRPGTIAHLRSTGERVFVLAVKASNTHIQMVDMTYPVNVQEANKSRKSAIIRLKTSIGLKEQVVLLEELQSEEEYAGEGASRIVEVLRGAGLNVAPLEDVLEELDESGDVEKDKKKFN